MADSTQVVLYDTDTFYERRLVSQDGDRSTFLVLKPGCLPAGARGFATTHVPIPSADVLRVHLLASLSQRPDATALEVEELAIDLVARIVLRAPVRLIGARSPADGRRSATRTLHHDLVVEAKRRLQSAMAEPITLAELAAGSGASPFHLARLFRLATGLSLHEYRVELRLRSSLERLVETRDDLATLALDLGFASHSHFDVRFRRAFGSSPSAVRALLRAGGAEMRTLVKAWHAMPA